MSSTRFHARLGRDAVAPVQQPPFAPAADVVVGDGNLLLTMDLPGVAARDLSIETQDDVLTVRGHRPAPPVQDGALVARHERRFGAFERHLRLPGGVDPDTITATLYDGVLSLLVPEPARPKPTRIRIGAGQPDEVRRPSLDGIAAELLKAPRKRSTR